MAHAAGPAPTMSTLRGSASRKCSFHPLLLSWRHSKRLAMLVARAVSAASGCVSFHAATRTRDIANKAALARTGNSSAGGCPQVLVKSLTEGEKDYQYGID